MGAAIAGVNWSEEENRKLADMWPENWTQDEIKEVFPLRTLTAIYNQASRLGLKKPVLSICEDELYLMAKADLANVKPIHRIRLICLDNFKTSKMLEIMPQMKAFTAHDLIDKGFKEASVYRMLSKLLQRGVIQVLTEIRKPQSHGGRPTKVYQISTEGETCLAI